MSFMASAAEIREWATARGMEVSDRGRVAAEIRDRYDAEHGGTVRSLPRPDEVDDLPPEVFGPVIDPAPPEDKAPPAAPDGEVPGDEPPGHIRRDWRQRPRQRAKTSGPKITAAIRGDIEAKIGFGLEIPGQFWAIRDPLCGGTFVEQVPAIAASLTNWVVRSPALTAWFTSPAGSGFMLALDTAAAVGPVVSVLMAHHVYHTVEAVPETGREPAEYAA